MHHKDETEVDREIGTTPTNYQDTVHQERETLNLHVNERNLQDTSDTPKATTPKKKKARTSKTQFITPLITVSKTYLKEKKLWDNCMIVSGMTRGK